MDFLVLWRPVGLTDKEHKQELRGNKKVETGVFTLHASSLWVPRGLHVSLDQRSLLP